MQVRLIAITQLRCEPSPPEDNAACIPGKDDQAEALIERAGRICYRSEATDTPEATARFIQRRIAEGHESIIEHASASFEISGISRSCSHQLVRHRLASYSQESQRYVDMSDPEWVTPPEIQADPAALAIWNECLVHTQTAYRQLRERGIKKEDARFLLPNAAATRLVMTANLRELLHIFRLRISPHAQWEIRQVAARMLEEVYPYAPNVFGALRTELRETHPSLFANLETPQRNS
jgi:thymidylate synthase (FAD)